MKVERAVLGVGMRKLNLAVMTAIFLSACGLEQKGTDFCSDKGGVFGWSERYGFVVVHCNNKQVKVFG